MVLAFVLVINIHRDVISGRKQLRISNLARKANNK